MEVKKVNIQQNQKKEKVTSKQYSDQDLSQNLDQKIILSSISKVHSAELDEEYNNELGKLLSEVQEINEINSQMNELISSQSEKIKEVDKTIDKTADTVDASNGQLILASDYQKSIFWKKSILLTICTAAVTAPVSIFAGGYAALAAGVGTFIAGGVTIFG
jgi:t-SNARE complex subunit (syntaxin)